MRLKAPATRNRGDRRCLALVSVATLAIGFLSATQAHAAKTNTPLKAKPPAGFEDLLRPQKTLVDIYFGDRRVGSVDATYAPGKLTFDDPAEVVGLIQK